MKTTDATKKLTKAAILRAAGWIQEPRRGSRQWRDRNGNWCTFQAAVIAEMGIPSAMPETVVTPPGTSRG